MRYTFLDFEFDSNNLILSKNGDDIDIRPNEAKLLALLLSDSTQVFSKDAILTKVWHDKVVSEQAVFQNISHLRAVFGNSAIKTFPKRGYQWQLNTSQIQTAVITEPRSVNITTTTIKAKPIATMPLTQKIGANATSDINSSDIFKVGPTEKKPMGFYALLTSLLVVFATAILILFPHSSDKVAAPAAISIAYIPFTQSLSNNTITLADDEFFDFTELPQLSPLHFETSIESEYPKLADKHPLILTANVRTYNSLTYLDFILKGPITDWRGQLTGSSNQAVISKLIQHLSQDYIYDLLMSPQSLEIRLAKLSIAHKSKPNDFINLGKLAMLYIQMEEFEKAMVMADKLANFAIEAQNTQQLGNALLLQSEILTRKELFELSSEKLASAISQFKKINDAKRLADAWFAQSWLDHQNKNYNAVKASLLKSAQLSLQVNDILRELDALTYLSVLAYKNKQATDQYLYLQQAERKMKAYNLPPYHFAKIPFHYAIFAQTPADKEPHFKQVLDFTKLTPDHWVAQSSRKSLLQYYLDENRLAEAKALIDNLSVTTTSIDSPQNSYLKTLFAQASKQTKDFNRLAKRTFEQAQLSGHRNLSLDVALLLCSDNNDSENYDFYSQYITEHAGENWRRYNKDKLLTLNL